MSDMLIFISDPDPEIYLWGFELEQNYYTSTFNEKIFFNISNIKHHYKDGTLLHFVEIPDINFLDCDKYHSNIFKIIETHSLFDIDTYLKYDLNIEDNDYIIDFASDNRNIKFLDWYVSSGYKLKYSENAFFPTRDNLDVSNWWLNSSLKLIYDHRSFDFASQHGYIQVLDWWINSGLELKYTKNSLSYFYYLEDEDECIKILDWWINFGLEIKYDEYQIEYAMMNHHIKILNWWLDSGLKIKTFGELTCCCDNECLEVLDWWKKSGLVMDYTGIINLASNNGYINILNWFYNSGFKLKYTEEAMNFPYNTKVLQWWLDSGLELLYDDLSMTCASNVEILEWWKTTTWA
ncbi:repeat protein [Moumouvirus goulette]|uniref:Repeat protein n=1 Tax=Moumouvirus goulette TaxID=1247379 RepID=M1NNX1_9VIRU|nr:repeat protein [Moumouvirus goulette]AGF85765.1 repeat protein [Moumouvirus goulette]